MQTNKILLKHFLPQFIIAGIVAAGLFGTGAYMISEKQANHQKITFKDVFLSFFVILGASALLLPILLSYKKSQKIASKIMQQYLHQEILKHPELKAFDKVYSNTTALKNIAAVVSNNLRPSEQQTILKIVTKIQQNGEYSKEAEEKNIECAMQEIIKILKEHAAVHPEFFDNLLVAVANADKMYIIPERNYTR